MKILFVWEVAGVASCMAKYLSRNGHTVRVIGSSEHDQCGFLDFYKQNSIPNLDFDDYCIKEAEYYDIIHVNSAYQLAWKIKHAYPQKKVVLEYHGSDARLNSKLSRSEWERPLDKIFISTPDLCENVELATYLPIIVDTEHFHLTEHREGAIFFKGPNYARPKDIPFHYVTLPTEGFVPYKNIPNILKDYDVYIDIQNHPQTGFEIQAHSKMGLEALSTGMTLYTYRRQFITELPEEHKPKNVIDKLEELYSEL